MADDVTSGRAVPKPGSDEARAEGCFCARMDNCYGRGWGGDGERYGWCVTEGCPVHAPVVPADAGGGGR
jgi:hypothetical protein